MSESLHLMLIITLRGCGPCDMFKQGSKASISQIEALNLVKVKMIEFTGTADYDKYTPSLKKLHGGFPNFVLINKDFVTENPFSISEFNYQDPSQATTLKTDYVPRNDELVSWVQKSCKVMNAAGSTDHIMNLLNDEGKPKRAQISAGRVVLDNQNTTNSSNQPSNRPTTSRIYARATRSTRNGQ